MEEYTTLEMIAEIMEDRSLMFKTKSDDLYKKISGEKEVIVFYDNASLQLRWLHNKMLMPLSPTIYKSKWTKVTINKVTCPTDKLKELILTEYPDYYHVYPDVKRKMILEFTPEVDIMFEFMESEVD